MRIFRVAIAAALAAIITLSIIPGYNSIPAEESSILWLAGNDPYTLDPAIASDSTSNTYIIQIFSGLVRLDDSMQPVVDIAESWQVDESSTIYTFYLRQNAYFHNGRQVTAADVKYSWERVCNPETGSNTAETFLGDICGAKDVINGSATEISGVEVIGDFTLQVTIDEPKSYFLNKLTYVTAYVVDYLNVADGGEWWRQPNGTGPFSLKSLTDGSSLSLKRNDQYYGEKAKIDEVVFRLSGGQEMNLYELDLIDVGTVNTSYIDKARDENGPFYEDLHVYPELSFYFLGFNCASPPFDDVDIRKAFTMAIDKERILSIVYKDAAEPASGILPPGTPGYQEDFEGLVFDVEEALKLIEESSYGSVANLPEITLTAIGWGGLISQELEAIVYEWRTNLGVEVKIRQLEPDTFLYNLNEEKDNIYYMGWIGDYPHPQAFLEILFGSGFSNNWGEYSNGLADSLMEQANTEQDFTESIEVYQQVEQIMVDDAACLPFWFGESYVLVKPYVKGFAMTPMGIPMLNKVYIEE